MANIKEDIKAICAGEIPTIVRMKKKQGDGMPERKLEMILKYALKIVTTISFTVLVLNADVWKLVAIGAIGTLASIIYIGMKD